MARIVRYYTAKDAQGIKRRHPVVKAEECEYWSAPRMWEGATAFIIGGGPSIREQNISSLAGLNVIGVNDAYTLGDWVNVCTFGDAGWFDEHDKQIVDRPDGSRHAGLREFAGLIVTFCPSILLHNRTDIRVMKPEPNRFWKEPHRIGWNGNTGIASINLALHFGAKRIVLVGFDMKSRGNVTNWHDNIRRAKGNTAAEPNYRAWLDNVIQCEKYRAKYWKDVAIFNATPDSAIPDNVWPCAEFEELVMAAIHEEKRNVPEAEKVQASQTD